MDKGKVVKAARIGLVAKGIVYILIGGLTALAAFGLGGEVSGRSDAFNWILNLPFGRILLGIVALGLLGYVFWRFYVAIKDPENKGWKRIAYFGSAITYGAIAYYAALLAIEGSGGSSGGDSNSRQFIAAKLLQLPAGQWIAGAVALVLIGIGLYQFYRAFSNKYKEKVDQSQMNEKEEKAYLAAGKAGYTARGVVFAIIGYMFMKAAVNSNPSQAEGTEGAFQFLQNTGYGPWLLGVVAFGLFLYGIFCLVMAKYRTIK